MSADQQLIRAAQTMINAAQHGRSVPAVLKKLCPHLHRQIALDGTQRPLLTLWGRSCNTDENTGLTIVHPAILEAIGKLARVPMRGRFVHAGLEHSYGYLFSLIETPYGPKRKRWVTTDLEEGFGLDPTLLGDRPRQGTLLGNLTGFLGRIVFRDEAPALRRLARFKATVAPELLHLDYRRFDACRIVERVPLHGAIDRQLSLCTDLVPFPKTPTNTEAENTLLIYSLQAGPDSSPRLITAFPVRAPMARELMDEAMRRDRVPLRLRYNAYYPGLFGRTIQGERFLVEPAAQN